MPTDPQHLKRKVYNDFKTTCTIIAAIVIKLTFVSFPIVFKFITCLNLVLIIDFSAFLSFTPIFNNEKINEK